MNVLIIRNAFKNDFGGAETYAYNLALALQEHTQKVLLVSKLEPLLKKCRANGVAAKKGPWNETQGWDKLYLIRYVTTTLWYCLQIIIHRIDVVNPQGRDDFIFATNAAWLLRKRVIWTDHGDLKYILDRTDKTHVHSPILGWILKASGKTSAIICVSESEKKEIARVAPELTNLVVVHNGVFVPQSKPVSRPRKAGLIVGTNARLVKAKGIMELLEGFAASKLSSKDLLWIIGSEDSDRQDYYDAAERLGITARVTFWGYVVHPNDYVATMDIFVHASYHEAFSLAVIEAAMLGKAIVATAVGGTPEIIDASCGILIKPRSSQDIAQALNKLAGDSQLRARLGQAVQAKAMKQFNFEAILVERLLPIYEGVT